MRALSSLTAVLFLLIAAPAGAALSTNHSGWLWGAPEPQGNSLSALEFQDATGYAAGEFGTLAAHERRWRHVGHRSHRARRSTSTGWR